MSDRPPLALPDSLQRKGHSAASKEKAASQVQGTGGSQGLHTAELPEHLAPGTLPDS